MRQLQRRTSDTEVRQRLTRDLVSAISCWWRVRGSYSGMSLSLTSTNLQAGKCQKAAEARQNTETRTACVPCMKARLASSGWNRTEQLQEQEHQQEQQQHTTAAARAGGSFPHPPLVEWVPEGLPQQVAGGMHQRDVAPPGDGAPRDQPPLPQAAGWVACRGSRRTGQFYKQPGQLRPFRLCGP